MLVEERPEDDLLGVADGRVARRRRPSGRPAAARPGPVARRPRRRRAWSGERKRDDRRDERDRRRLGERQAVELVRRQAPDPGEVALERLGRVRAAGAAAAWPRRAASGGRADVRGARRLRRAAARGAARGRSARAAPGRTASRGRR